ncbi:PREDICTED: lipid storage droplets surface-binding protein 2-like [Ceratosolen solmsi marchali]|uniref:Lipid storage droplets surface-binding protein 2-like n=1 Tax=Ceratosolen solmsi marchali TaxID=326594 RepID=A0AAJ6YGQ8_9HYME|nr:PREDICTED: lipid storage droplets surface-binding protein 2-like [Ceratosolen solmsi marchali]
MTTQPAQLPQLEVMHRMLELPLVELALNKSSSTYTRFKDSHQLVKWALSTAESSLTSATRQAAPYAKKLEMPIHFVDHTLCRGLDHIEKKMPIVKQKPELILENAYMLAVHTAASTFVYANELVTTQAATIKDMSWNKMNQILSTNYGIAAVHGLDCTAIVVEMLIDKYFPPIGNEEFPESVSMEEDKLLHTLQTVGRLSNKATRRVYMHVALQLRTLNKDNLKTYLSNVVSFLHMTQYIALISDKVNNLSVAPTKEKATSKKHSKKVK